MELLIENPHLPYCEMDVGCCKMRVYVEDVEEETLRWHKDRVNAHFKVVGGKDWMLQLEHEKPVVLEIGKSYYIPKEVMHRIIKGKYNLIIEVVEE